MRRMTHIREKLDSGLEYLTLQPEKSLAPNGGAKILKQEVSQMLSINVSSK